MISIIIPIYNQAGKLPQCLDSILNQTLIQPVMNEHNEHFDTPKHQSAENDNIEVIVVDDGSRDNSGEVADFYKSKFKKAEINYVVISHESNMGAPAARNSGWKKSIGEFLFFCDADTVLNKDCLEVMLKTLKEQPKASYVYSSFLWGRKKFRVGKWSENKLKSGPCIHTMSLIRREHFPENGWDETVKKLQDWDLWLTMLEQGRRGYWIDKVLFKVRTGGTMSSWLPSLAYKLMPFLPSVKKYKEAVKTIKEKHSL